MTTTVRYNTWGELLEASNDEQTAEDTIFALADDDGEDTIGGWWANTVGASMYDVHLMFKNKPSAWNDECKKFFALVTLLVNPFLYLTDRLASEVPPLTKTLAILAKMELMETAQPRLGKIELRKWDGLERSWVKFAIDVRIVINSLGLGSLVELPKDPDTVEVQKLEIMALAKFDGLFFIALNNAMTHANVKTPRQDLVNMAMWKGRPYSGAKLWEICCTVFDSECTQNQRRSYYDNALTTSCVNSKEMLHLDGVGINVACTRL